jgi:hypothetical protein
MPKTSDPSAFVDYAADGRRSPEAFGRGGRKSKGISKMKNLNDQFSDEEKQHLNYLGSMMDDPTHPRNRRWRTSWKLWRRGASRPLTRTCGIKTRLSNRKAHRRASHPAIVLFRVVLGSPRSQAEATLFSSATAIIGPAPPERTRATDALGPQTYGRARLNAHPDVRKACFHPL